MYPPIDGGNYHCNIFAPLPMFCSWAQNYGKNSTNKSLQGYNSFEATNKQTDSTHFALPAWHFTKVFPHALRHKNVGGGWLAFSTWQDSHAPPKKNPLQSLTPVEPGLPSREHPTVHSTGHSTHFKNRNSYFKKSRFQPSNGRWHIVPSRPRMVHQNCFLQIGHVQMGINLGGGNRFVPKHILHRF